MIEIKDKTVLRDGDEIGMIEGDVCMLSAEVGPSIKGAIRKAADNAALAFEVGSKQQLEMPDAPVPASPTVGAPVISNEALVAEMERRGLMPAEAAPVLPEAASSRLTTRAELVVALIDKAQRGEIPAPPPKHPAMGDKDPAFVAWVQAHADPRVFAAIYGNRRTPATTQEFEHAAQAAERRLAALETNEQKI